MPVGQLIEHGDEDRFGIYKCAIKVKCNIFNHKDVLTRSWNN